MHFRFPPCMFSFCFASYGIIPHVADRRELIIRNFIGKLSYFPPSGCGNPAHVLFWIFQFTIQHKKACKSGAGPRLQAFYESLIRITSMNFSRILFTNSFHKFFSWIFFMNSYNIFFLCILLINSLLHRRSISPEYGMPSSEAVYSPSGNSHGLSVPAGLGADHTIWSEIHFCSG